MPLTPFVVVSQSEHAVLGTKRELLARCRDVEREALTVPPPAIAATLQDERYLTPHTRAVYTALASRGVPGRLFARGLQSWLAPGVEGVPLEEDDPLVDEWTVVVPSVAPVVFAATDAREPYADDLDRGFRYAVSRDPEVVRACAELLGITPELLSAR